MKNSYRLLILLLIAVYVLPRCSERQGARTLDIKLRWVKAYPAEEWSDVKTGLLWSLSFLGAELPVQFADSIIRRVDSAQFILDLRYAGFSKEAQPILMDILDSLKYSEEYEDRGAVDVGRFIMVTEGSSWNYYAITGVAKTYDEFALRHPSINEQQFHVKVSSVSDRERRIRFSPAKEIKEIAFIAEEGTGSCDDGTFSTSGFETFDVMPNGQLRFAVYDEGGKLISGSPSAVGKAGKPGKCLWCHELNVQGLFVPTPEPKTDLTIHGFQVQVDSSQALIERYRKTLHPMINFTNRQDHTYSELLYISFMEPSAFRLANEWGADTIHVKGRFGKLPTHMYAEFPFLGSSWYRYYADSLSSYRTLSVPLSMRENGAIEPKYYRK